MQRELKILLFVSVFINLAGGAFGPVYAVFVKEIGGDLLTAGIAQSIYALAAGALMFVLSRWEDHVKHQEKLVVLGRIFTVIGYFTYMFVNSSMSLFAAQIFLGIGTAIIAPAFDSLYSKHLDKGKFASQWGVWESSNWFIV